MGNSVEDIDDSGPGKRPPSRLMGLPDELAEWAEDNKDQIEQIRRALKHSYASLTEDQIWETIAATHSPEWRQARQDLHEAEKAWDNLNHPINAPLGAIGQALDSDETDSVRDRFAVSLADFTVINEGLIERPDLKNLLQVLLVQKRMLDQSIERIEQVRRTIKELAGMTSLREDFKHAARNPSRIRRQFRTSMLRLLAPVMNVTVPWWQGT